MFLKTTLLVHKAGSTYHEINSLDDHHLEICARDFVFSDECPEFILEEYKRSQESEDEPIDQINDDPLLIEPEQEVISNEQDEIMCLMKTFHIDDEMIDEIDDINGMLVTDPDADWQQDFRELDLLSMI